MCKLDLFEIGNLVYKKKIKTLRRAGLNSPAQEYSSENIAFKILRREDTLQQLNDMKYDMYDKILSMAE
tara:strand:- start:173 stop:379 length:207 start_codon:yes stop_codon:yes gene_type:complete